jgi:hypothetical protein
MATGAERMAVGIVLERSAIQNAWRGWRWRVAEIVPGLPDQPSGWRPLRDDGRVARFAAGGQWLELHRNATEDYKAALSASPPQLYVVLRAAEGDPAVPFLPFLVTASPFEAHAYQESGEDLVDCVPMPEPVAAWIEDFVDRHHVDQPFYKRKRKGADRSAGEASEFVRVGWCPGSDGGDGG